MIATRFVMAALTLVCATACGDSNSDAPPNMPPEDASTMLEFPIVVPPNLSELGLFDSAMPHEDGGPRPTGRGARYTLSTPLFSDYALKWRSVHIPDGMSATFTQDVAGEWVLDFPAGTIITKTFGFTPDLRSPTVDVKWVETRVLVRQQDGWEAYPYVWNDGQDEATLAPGGRVLSFDFIDDAGDARTSDYLVPSRNQCLICHHVKDDAGEQIMGTIGPKARFLNDGTQLEAFVAAGLVDSIPSEAPAAINAFDDAAHDLEARARAYLDINCAHCHRPDGTAGITSRLFLNFLEADAFHLGVCKRPGSAGGAVGGEFDIVPGDHTQSILWYRTQTEESGKMMPQIGRSLAHRAAADLLAAWIDAMPAQACE